jgi:hypothetical protein
MKCFKCPVIKVPFKMTNKNIEFELAACRDHIQDLKSYIIKKFKNDLDKFSLSFCKIGVSHSFEDKE